MQIEKVVEYLKQNKRFMQGVVHWQRLAAQPAQFAEFPTGLDHRLKEVLQKRNINKLYSHQLDAWNAVQSGLHPVIVTPTASGKSLAYLLPVLNDLIQNRQNRALFIFPTKALAQDQWQVLEDLNRIGALNLKSYTYDGDTATTVRKTIRSAGQIVITNADMLHAGILPHHSQWIKLFENLKYVVIDELHIYKGVFGSHLSNVMRRLHRILRFYRNDRTRFIMSSATIANPLQHAAAITNLSNSKLHLIGQSGAPMGAKEIILYNPPVIQEDLGIRRSSLKEASFIGRQFLEAGISAIFFVRSRIRVEVLANYLRRVAGNRKNGVKAYRGGYLPLERRNIEKGLRNGEIHTVVSTNALELGVDIGSLDVAVAVGYPGSIASLWQQFGRAGRRDQASLAIFVASSSPLEQYFMSDPKSLLQAPIEQALINPDNYMIEMAHLRCAAFELPLEEGEKFGSLPVMEVARYFEKENLVKYSQGRFYWSNDLYPANDISLRSASQENFVITDRGHSNRVIGEVDFYAAPTLIHEGAIYLHQGQSFFIEQLDWERRQAFAVLTKSDYFTDAEEKVDVQIVQQLQHLPEENADSLWQMTYGEIALRRQAVLFKKIKLYTHENIGWGKIYLPEIQMHTESLWISFHEEQIGLTSVQRGPVLNGLAYLLGHLAPGYLMCDQNDIRCRAFVKSPFQQLPTILFYDTMPGGVALSKRLFHLILDLWAAGKEVVSQCSCSEGCPSCIGPIEALLPDSGEIPSENIKTMIINFIERILAEPVVTDLRHPMTDLEDFTTH